MDRADHYLRYRIESGAYKRYGPSWQTPERLDRIDREYDVVTRLGFSGYFIILMRIMDHCEKEGIVVGPGRGSVGGFYCGYLIGIHHVDSLKYNLLFERFLNEDRVSYPDVDIDVSQRDRPRVLQYIRDEFSKSGNAVLQVAAYTRMGGRAVIDNLAAATSQTDPSAYATAENLKKCLPAEGSITGGTKQARELAWWLENGIGDRRRFKEIATQAGWMNALLKLDGLPTHLSAHAAGVVILAPDDLSRLPQTSTNGQNMMTGFDMYSLDALAYLKYDWLGLRTLDIVSDAHRFIGGSGSTRDLVQLWHDEQDRPEPYALAAEGDTRGIFQFDTDGYRRTLLDFQPERFEHFIQLTALYRPGALDYTRPEDGKNMVEVFILRHHGRETVSYPDPSLEKILGSTHGVILYQEQSMQIARMMCGWDYKQADDLRKVIGKKQVDRMKPLLERFTADAAANGYSEGVIKGVVDNISAAARYSWNLSHAVEYAVISWWTCYFKALYPAAFYAALVNSYEGQQHAQEKQAGAVAEARQKITLEPPDVNLAQEGYIAVDDDGHVGNPNVNRLVFGLSGIKGMGPASRDPILLERTLSGHYESFTDFAHRLPSLGTQHKRALIQCGAFDSLPVDSQGSVPPELTRAALLGTVQKTNSDKTWTLAEHINHNNKLKKPRELPPLWEVSLPDDRTLAKGEVEVTGFYVSKTPLRDLEKWLSRVDPANHFGGEIEAIRKKRDRNGAMMAWLTLTTPALTKLKVTIFGSLYERIDHRLDKGEQVIVRGRPDGPGACIADAVSAPGDLRHFHRIAITDTSGRQVEQLPSTHKERLALIERYEQAGARVRLL